METYTVAKGYYRCTYGIDNTSNDCKFNISFSSNGKDYIAMEFLNYGGHYLLRYYYSATEYDSIANEVNFLDDRYRTIRVNEETTLGLTAFGCFDIFVSFIDDTYEQKYLEGTWWFRTDVPAIPHTDILYNFDRGEEEAICELYGIDIEPVYYPVNNTTVYKGTPYLRGVRRNDSGDVVWYTQCAINKVKYDNEDFYRYEVYGYYDSDYNKCTIKPGYYNAFVVDWFLAVASQVRFSRLYTDEVVSSSGEKCFKSVIKDGEFAPFVVTSDNRGMIGYTDSTTQLNIPKTLTDQYGVVYRVNALGYEAFYNCTSLTRVEIPNSVIAIGGYAFENCSSLTSIEIPDSVEYINYAAFRGCTSLKSVYITDIEAWCNLWFEKYYSNPMCNGANLYLKGELVTELVIPNTRTGIQNFAFSGCESLTSIVIPDSVTSIGNSAFANCKNLTSINYRGTPAQWNAIYKGDSWDAGADKYTITYNYGVPGLFDANSNLVASWDNLVKTYSMDCTKNYTSSNYQTTATSPSYVLTKRVTGAKLVMPDDVTVIGDYAFALCHETSIEIPPNLTSLGEYAFFNCNGFTEVVIPKSLTTIGTKAFYFCTSAFHSVVIDGTKDLGEDMFHSCLNLTSIILNPGVMSIGKGTFFNCNHLPSIELPNTVISIGDYAFAGCSSLTSIKVDADNPNYKDIDGNLYTKDVKTLIRYAPGKTDTSFTITSGVIIIGNSAFDNCKSLTSIDIPDSVTSIGDSAFYNCYNITSIEIGDSVTSIGDEAFYNCKSLTSIKYRGTQVQWNAISKGTEWDKNTGNYTITYNYTD